MLITSISMYAQPMHHEFMTACYCGTKFGGRSWFKCLSAQPHNEEGEVVWMLTIHMIMTAAIGALSRWDRRVIHPSLLSMFSVRQSSMKPMVRWRTRGPASL